MLSRNWDSLTKRQPLKMKLLMLHLRIWEAERYITKTEEEGDDYDDVGDDVDDDGWNFFFRLLKPQGKNQTQEVRQEEGRSRRQGERERNIGRGKRGSKRERREIDVSRY